MKSFWAGPLNSSRPVPLVPVSSSQAVVGAIIGIGLAKGDRNINLNKLNFGAGSIGQADGWVANGIVTWTSGNNVGMSGEVKSFAANTYELFIPTVYQMQVGDTFEVTTGCDKTSDTCKSKFSNVINFGGFPHIRTDVMYK